jgi:hypothetical protein
MDWLGKELGYKSWEDWYLLTNELLFDNAGIVFASKYKNKINLLVSTIYKEYKWFPWLFKNVDKGFWYNIDNQKLYMDWLGEKLGYKSLEDFYKITNKIIHENNGGTLANYYKSNIFNLLSAVYKDKKWIPWLFIQIEKGYWEKTENRKIYLDWLIERLKFNKNEDIYKLHYLHFVNNGAATLIYKFNGDICNLIQATYTNVEWERKKFSKKNSSLGEIEWLEYMSKTRASLRYVHNNGQYRIPNTNNYVDGFYETDNEILQFHGCFYHGCPACFLDRNKLNKKKDKTMEKLYNDTIALEKKMKDMGYTVTVMWECEWNKQKASLLDIES